MKFTVPRPSRAGGELSVEPDRPKSVDLAFYERLVALGAVRIQGL